MSCCESSTATGLACTPAAIPASERTQHFALARELFGVGACVEDIPNGYALRLHSSQFEALAKFVSNERKCCVFLRFEITIESGDGPVLLRMTGPQGTRDVLREELGAASRCGCNARSQA